MAIICKYKDKLTKTKAIQRIKRSSSHKKHTKGERKAINYYYCADCDCYHLTSMKMKEQLFNDWVEKKTDRSRKKISPIKKNPVKIGCKKHVTAKKKRTSNISM